MRAIQRHRRWESLQQIVANERLMNCWAMCGPMSHEASLEWLTVNQIP